jgi:hypothetical protein
MRQWSNVISAWIKKANKQLSALDRFLSKDKRVMYCIMFMCCITLFIVRLHSRDKFRRTLKRGFIIMFAKWYWSMNCDENESFRHSWFICLCYGYLTQGQSGVLLNNLNNIVQMFEWEQEQIPILTIYTLICLARYKRCMKTSIQLAKH